MEACKEKLNEIILPSESSILDRITDQIGILFHQRQLPINFSEFVRELEMMPRASLQEVVKSMGKCKITLENNQHGTARNVDIDEGIGMLLEDLINPVIRFIYEVIRGVHYNDGEDIKIFNSFCNDILSKKHANQL